jgi:hypothetical protein
LRVALVTSSKSAAQNSWRSTENHN